MTSKGKPKKAIISFLEFVFGLWKPPSQECRCPACLAIAARRRVIRDAMQPSRN